MYIVASQPQVSNPVPRVIRPDWLHKKIREKDDKFRQHKINDLFTPKQKDQNTDEQNTEIDMEDFGTTTKAALKFVLSNLTAVVKGGLRLVRGNGNKSLSRRKEEGLEMQMSQRRFLVNHHSLETEIKQTLHFSENKSWLL